MEYPSLPLFLPFPQFGILLFELLSRQEPFAEARESLTEESVLRDIAERDLRPSFAGVPACKSFTELAVDCWCGRDRREDKHNIIHPWRLRTVCHAHCQCAALSQLLLLRAFLRSSSAAACDRNRHKPSSLTRPFPPLGRHRNPSRRPSAAELADLLATASEEARPEMESTDRQRHVRGHLTDLLREMGEEISDLQAGDEDSVAEVALEYLERAMGGSLLAAAVATLTLAAEPAKPGGRAAGGAAAGGSTAAATSLGADAPRQPSGGGGGGASKDPLPPLANYHLAVTCQRPGVEDNVADILKLSLQAAERGSAAVARVKAARVDTGAPETSLGFLLEHNRETPISSGTTAECAVLLQCPCYLSHGHANNPMHFGHAKTLPTRSSFSPIHDPSTSAPSSVRRGVRSFEDWATIQRDLPLSRPDEAHRAWSHLLRVAGNGGGSGSGGDGVVGFVLVFWSTSTLRFAMHAEETLLANFSTALGRAVAKRRAQGVAEAQERAGNLQKLQQRFLASMSHGVRRLQSRRMPSDSAQACP